MAKSVYEPKKIVGYTNTITPVGNLPTPAPVRPVSRPAVTPPSTPPPGPINQPVTPPPPPPPTIPVQPANPTPPVVIPGPGFGFEFDGNTSLTGSYTNRLLGTNSRVSFFIEPKWGPNDTGSFTVFHIGPDSTDISSSLEVAIQREEGVGGYIDTSLKVVADSQGETKTIKMVIDGNGSYPGPELNGFHSASLDGSPKDSFHLSLGFFKLNCSGCWPAQPSHISIDGNLSSKATTGNFQGTYSTQPNYLSTPPAGYKISIGRKIQDESQCLPARLDDLIFTNSVDISKELYNNGKRLNYGTVILPGNSSIFEIFTFDRDLTGTLGTSLEVVGTETYYTGSFL